MNAFVLFIIDRIWTGFFYEFGQILSNYWAVKHKHQPNLTTLAEPTKSSAEAFNFIKQHLSQSITKPSVCVREQLVTD